MNTFLNELMLNDWFLIMDVPVKCNTATFGPSAFSATHYQPMPITHDILGRNFYFQVRTTRYEIGRLIGRQCKYGDKGYLFIQSDGSCHIALHDKVNNLSLNIHYVHELQNILRMFGLADLADNMEVKDEK